MTFVNAGSNFVVSLTLLNYGEMYINTSVLALLSLWMKSYGVIVQMKATEMLLSGTCGTVYYAAQGGYNVRVCG